MFWTPLHIALIEQELRLHEIRVRANGDTLHLIQENESRCRAEECFYCGQRKAANERCKSCGATKAKGYRREPHIPRDQTTVKAGKVFPVRTRQDEG